MEIYKFPAEQWTRIFYIDRYVARIVEGCNAVSVMILFASFVMAFAGKFKRTLAFILIGIILIHILNLFRIAFLATLLYHYPQHSHLTHGVLFPLIIYGFVFLLWVVWVKKYSGFISDKKDENNQNYTFTTTVSNRFCLNPILRKHLVLRSFFGLFQRELSRKSLSRI